MARGLKALREPQGQLALQARQEHLDPLGLVALLALLANLEPQDHRGLQEQLDQLEVWVLLAYQEQLARLGLQGLKVPLDCPGWMARLALTVRRA